MRGALVTALLPPRVLGPAASRAHDSLAPLGASHNWLPEEEWVGRHWIPFDEQALKAELGLQRRDLHAYLYNDHHTLADLARARGLEPQALADRLVAPWQGITDAHRAVLRERTLRILTQGHLAQHMFFHVFHGAALHRLDRAARDGRDVLSAPSRGRSSSYAEIARAAASAAERLTTGIAALFEIDRRDGVERLEAWPAEAERILARRSAWLDCWLAHRRRGDDPANPYGKNRFLHGVHAGGLARDRRGAARRRPARRPVPPRPAHVLLADPTEVVIPARSVSLGRARDRASPAPPHRARRSPARRSGAAASIYPNLDAAPPADVADARRLWERSKRLATRRSRPSRPPAPSATRATSARPPAQALLLPPAQHQAARGRSRARPAAPRGRRLLVRPAAADGAGRLHVPRPRGQGAGLRPLGAAVALALRRLVGRHAHVVHEDLRSGIARRPPRPEFATAFNRDFGDPTPDSASGCQPKGHGEHDGTITLSRAPWR